MRYILNDSGFIETISFTYEIECNNKTCIEYTGSVPTGYESLAIWSETANINAYKIVDGNLTYDSDEDARLQELWETQSHNQNTTGDTLPIGSIVEYEGDTVPDGYVEVADDNVYSNEEKVIGTWVAGQPLYRKVFSINTAINAGEELIVPHDIENANLVMVKNAYLYKLSNGNCYPLPITLFEGATKEDKISIKADRTNMFFYSVGSWDEGWYKVVILEYTKTTD